MGTDAHRLLVVTCTMILLTYRRPQLPAAAARLDDGMKTLMEQCWHPDASERPTAAQAVKQLRDAVLSLGGDPRAARRSVRGTL